MRNAAGKIITFYSYKGGTGRTMALSNLAWVLASNGYDVLLIDWDLEAPGLHRYLRHFLIDQELTSSPGLIEYVWEAVRVAMTPVGDDKKHTRQFPSLDDYVVGLDWDFKGGGSIAFIPAGRQDANYAQRVNTFDWDSFYERLGGGRLLQAAREELRASYDFILIDSRTGVSDTSSICTVQMPDQLVVLFTLNRQSIQGAAAVAESVHAQRGDEMPIFPVPTRIEEAETDKTRLALTFAQDRFAGLLRHIQPATETPNTRLQQRYWNDVKTAHKPFYAFEEVPAAFKDIPGDHGSVLAASERLASWLTDGAVSELKMYEESQERDAVVEAYRFTDARREPSRESPPRHGHLAVRIRRLINRGLLPHRWQYAATFAATAVAVTFVSLWYSATLANQSVAAQFKTYATLVTVIAEQLDAVRSKVSDLTQSSKNGVISASQVEGLNGILGSVAATVNAAGAVSSRRSTDTGDATPPTQMPPSNGSTSTTEPATK